MPRGADAALVPVNIQEKARDALMPVTSIVHDEGVGPYVVRVHQRVFLILIREFGHACHLQILATATSSACLQPARESFDIRRRRTRYLLCLWMRPVTLSRRRRMLRPLGVPALRCPTSEGVQNE